MSGSVVYVVAKAPQAGAVKTRLLPALAPSLTAELARAFLLDTFALARRARGVAVRAVCRDATDAAVVRELGGPELEVLCQHQAGLGAALEECFHHGLADGFREVAVLGSDSPTLPPSVLEAAFAALDAYEVALGPTEDGGYYLLAARAVYPTLFRDMVWSTPHVLDETRARCVAAGLRSMLLPRWYDVDTPADLDRLREELAAATDDVALHTRRAMLGIAATPADAAGVR